MLSMIFQFSFLIQVEGAGDYSELFRRRLVFDAFCHKNTENNLENFENSLLTPPTRGLKIRQKRTIIVWGCLIAQMKRFDALITAQKNPTLCKVPFLKKIKKNC